jgi:hypothetical protein
MKREQLNPHDFHITPHKCERCGKTWFPRRPGKPKICIDKAIEALQSLASSRPGSSRRGRPSQVQQDERLTTSRPVKSRGHHRVRAGNGDSWGGPLRKRKRRAY